MTVSTRIRFTYRDYKSIPETDPRRFELLDGELVMVPAPSVLHQRVVRNLTYLLWSFVRRRRLGWVFASPIDVVLEKDEEEVDVVQPDVLFISRERGHIMHHDEIRGAPDLVVEVLSPVTEARDRGYKRTLYTRHGVKEYWLVDPEKQTLEVYTLTPRGLELTARYQSGQKARSPLLGLEFPADQIFAEW